MLVTLTPSFCRLFLSVTAAVLANDSWWNRLMF